MIVLILKLVCFSIIFSWYRPIQDILDNLRDDYKISKGLERVVIYIISKIKKVLQCPMCFSFNLSLIYTFDIGIASIVCVCVVVLLRIIELIPIRL